MEAIKKYERQIIFAALAFLVSSLSFAMGYLVNRNFNRTPIIIERCGDSASSSGL